MTIVNNSGECYKGLCEKNCGTSFFYGPKDIIPRDNTPCGVTRPWIDYESVICPWCGERIKIHRIIRDDYLCRKEYWE